MTDPAVPIRTLGRARAATTLLVAVLLGAGPAALGEEAGAPQTLADCVVRASTEEPRVRVAQEQAELAAARLQEERWRWFPSLSLVSYFSYAPGSGGDVASPKGDLFGEWGPVFQVEIKGEMPLYTFGRLSAEEEAATHEREAARAGVIDAVHEASFRVRKAWYERLAARARVLALDDGLEALDGLAARLQRMEEDDDADFDPIDTVRLRVRRSELVIRRSEAERARADAEATLRATLGIAPGESVAFDEPPLRPSIVAPGSVDEYVDIARTLNPQVRGRFQAELGARDRLRARDRAFYPEFLLIGKFRYGYAGAYTPQHSPFADDSANSWEASVLVGLRVPLDVPRLVTEREEADATLAQRAWDRRIAADRVAQRVIERHHVVRDLLALLPGRRDAARAARGWYGARSDTWKLGNVSLDEVLVALAHQVDRQVALVDTIRDLDVAVAELSRAVGVDVAALRTTQLPAVGEGGAERRLPPGIELPPDLPPALRERILERLRER